MVISPSQSRAVLHVHSPFFLITCSLECFFQSRAVLDALTIRRLGFLIAENDDAVSTAASHLVQTVIVSVTELEKFRNERDKHETERKGNFAAKMRPYPNISEKIGII